MKRSEKETPIELPIQLQKYFEEIKHGVQEIIPEEHLKKKLLSSYESGNPLIIKAGFDPTAPDLHLGHVVLLQKLRVFQELSHEVQFLIGDYTAMIGDPSGRSEIRPPLSLSQVEKNANTYKEQVFKILDAKKTKVIYNSSWLGKLDLKDMIQLMSKYTVARILERDDFFKRYKGGKPISMVEFLYPLLQGFDSVAMKADVELGGTDQKFNLLLGRDLQTAYQQEPQVVITLPLLVGLDGTKKMSKSLNNYIGVNTPPKDVYGKLMSISDPLMWEYYTLLSGYSKDEIEELKGQVSSKELHPKKVKEKLALNIITRFHEKSVALETQSEWNKIHNPNLRGIPEDIPEWKARSKEFADGEVGILNALRLSKAVSSNSEARRLMESRGIHHISGDSEKVMDDPRYQLKKGKFLFRIGKRKFIRIIVD